MSASSTLKAAETRRRRRAIRCDLVAARISMGFTSRGPAERCVICGRHLSDEASRRRGVGPECWGQVLATLAEDRR